MAVNSVPARPVATPRPRPVTSGQGPSSDAISNARKALEDGFARGLAPVPADVAGKKKWLEDAKARQTGLKKSLDVLKDAWFKGNMPFETYTGYSKKMWDFERPIRDVEYDLAPPRPLPPANGKQEYPDYLTPGLVEAMNKHPESPLNVFGAIALPFTLLLDGMTGLAKLTGARPAPEAPAGKKD